VASPDQSLQRLVGAKLGADTDPFLLHLRRACRERAAIIGRRTKDALAAAKAGGVRLGALRPKAAEYQHEAAEPVRGPTTPRPH
jgi:phosphoglycolate phosphatase-like HAD superfamily hydrolase